MNSHSQLSNQFIDTLKKLPKKRTLRLEDDTEIFLCHGSPNSIDEYIYPNVSSKKVADFSN